jgi:hypothetical protein
MYWTGTNPFTGTDCFVERSPTGRERQKATLTGGGPRKPAALADGRGRRRQRK